MGRPCAKLGQYRTSRLGVIWQYTPDAIFSLIAAMYVVRALSVSNFQLGFVSIWIIECLRSDSTISAV
jgi:hypothetical protein